MPNTNVTAITATGQFLLLNHMYAYGYPALNWLVNTVVRWVINKNTYHIAFFLVQKSVSPEPIKADQIENQKSKNILFLIIYFFAKNENKTSISDALSMSLFLSFFPFLQKGIYPFSGHVKNWRTLYYCLVFSLVVVYGFKKLGAFPFVNSQLKLKI